MANYNASDCLETKISDMTDYLERVVLGEHTQLSTDSGNPSCSNWNQPYEAMGAAGPAPTLPYVPTLVRPVNSLVSYTQNYSLSISSQYTLTSSVTSALVSSISANSSRRLSKQSLSYNGRPKKWGHHAHIEKEPDTSNLDIEATMTEIGLTPESLKNSEVYQLFSLFKELAFCLYADYIFQGSIYEGKTLPNTMSVSVQTKHAIWSSSLLLRKLRDSLQQMKVPVDYQVKYCQCKLSLDKLQTAIFNLETFKSCVLEHRRGKFVMEKEAQENLIPLKNCLNVLIKCVGESRLFVQVYEWEIKKHEEILKQAAVQLVEETPEPAPREDTDNPPVKSRPSAARRYIG